MLLVKISLYCILNNKDTKRLFVVFIVNFEKIHTPFSSVSIFEHVNIYCVVVIQIITVILVLSAFIRANVLYISTVFSRSFPKNGCF